MRLLLSLCFASLAVFSTSAAPPIVDDWKYSFRQPANGWEKPRFDDSAWKHGSGGFGIPGTPGSRVGTHWATKNIWLRKRVNLKSIPAKPALLIHHDESTEVFINGLEVAAFTGYTTKFKVVPIDSKAIKAGANLIAVHCNQTVGGQFIDVHLVDANNVPELPQAKRGTKPFISQLITKWGERVTPKNAWTEYPRPQLQRDNWTNLNGEWDYAITSAKQEKAPKKWAGKILVPFSLESGLSGVQRLLDASEALWYRRSFTTKRDAKKRLMLNFEAVDYRCEAFVNGRSVGKHQGGNTPFSFDVTGALQNGANEFIPVLFESHFHDPTAQLTIQPHRREADPRSGKVAYQLVVGHLYRNRLKRLNAVLQVHDPHYGHFGFRRE
ncbi:MAG: sugar-binding domain-containing protein [Limisphaerales bacterium]